tara:strand:+ start:356 stop:514 length:159 start_codon:yes stop_codon:yes gene_type:complete
MFLSDGAKLGILKFKWRTLNFGAPNGVKPSNNKAQKKATLFLERWLFIIFYN